MDVSIGKELELKFPIPTRSLTFTNLILSTLLTTRVSRQIKCVVAVMNGLLFHDTTLLKFVSKMNNSYNFLRVCMTRSF